MECFRAIVVTLGLRQDTSAVERGGTRRGCHRPSDGQRGFDLLASLGDMAAKPPETPQRRSQCQRPSAISLAAQPIKCSSQVVVLAFQTIQPGNGRGSGQVRL